MHMGNQMNEEDAVFARAMLFLYQSALENIGFGADLRAVKAHPEEEKEAAS